MVSGVLRRQLSYGRRNWWSSGGARMLRWPGRRSDRGPWLRRDTPSPSKRGETLATLHLKASVPVSPFVCWPTPFYCLLEFSFHNLLHCPISSANFPLIKPRMILDPLQGYFSVNPSAFVLFLNHLSMHLMTKCLA